MKTIITAIAIIFASITLANAFARFNSDNRVTDAHCFKAEELEIEAEVLKDEALAHEVAIEKRLEQLDQMWINEQKKVPALRNTIDYGRDEQLNSHHAHAARLRNEATRLQARAEAHQRRCEGDN